MAEDVTPETTVTYTVREKLDELTGIARGIDRRLDSKVDKDDLLGIERRLDDHGARLTGLESWRHDKDVEAKVRSDERHRRWTIREKVFATVCSVALAGGSIAGVMAVFH